LHRSKKLETYSKKKTKKRKKEKGKELMRI
jgi:hypothetical protein